MNHRINEKKRLLDTSGAVAEPGWATQLVSEYSPFDIKASRLRIKEWDYYITLDDSGYGFATVMADNRYTGLVTATFFDFNNGKKYDFVVPKLLPMGQMGMPSNSSRGDIYHKSSSCEMSYYLEKGGRHIKGKYSKCLLHGEMEFDLFLKQPKTDDTMVIATPWATDSKAFYYNQKINCMPASGYVKINGKTYEFAPERNFGTLDWGRGVWTYDNTWYWSSGNGVVDGKRFGFNIGYGFGNTKAASENMIFYDGKCNKLDRLRFEIPKDNIMNPWKFISSDGRFDMDFIPVYDNRTLIDIGIIGQNAHQVFGRMSGKAVLDDGTALDIKDLLVFAEKVRNRY